MKKEKININDKNRRNSIKSDYKFKKEILNNDYYIPKSTNRQYKNLTNNNELYLSQEKEHNLKNNHNKNQIFISDINTPKFINTKKTNNNYSTHSNFNFKKTFSKSIYENKNIDVKDKNIINEKNLTSINFNNGNKLEIKNSLLSNSQISTENFRNNSNRINYNKFFTPLTSKNSVNCSVNNEDENLVLHSIYSSKQNKLAKNKKLYFDIIKDKIFDDEKMKNNDAKNNIYFFNNTTYFNSQENNNNKFQFENFKRNIKSKIKIRSNNSISQEKNNIRYQLCSNCNSLTDIDNYFHNYTLSNFSNQPKKKINISIINDDLINEKFNYISQEDNTDINDTNNNNYLTKFSDDDNFLVKDNIISPRDNNINKINLLDEEFDKLKYEDINDDSLNLINSNFNDEKNNFDDFNSLKKDFELLFTKKFINGIKNDLIGFELNLAIEKILSLFYSYNNEVESFYIQNNSIKKLIKLLFEKIKHIKKKINKIKLKNENYKISSEYLMVEKENNFIFNEDIKKQKIIQKKLIENIINNNIKYKKKQQLKLIIESLILKKQKILLNNNNIKNKINNLSDKQKQKNRIEKINKSDKKYIKKNNFIKHEKINKNNYNKVSKTNISNNKSEIFDKINNSTKRKKINKKKNV